MMHYDVLLCTYKETISSSHQEEIENVAEAMIIVYRFKKTNQ